MKIPRHALRQASLAIVAFSLLITAVPASAAQDDSEAMITCTVRIEHNDQLAESFADGLTIEEAEDHALEGACALRCVMESDESAEDDSETAPTEKAGTMADTPTAEKETAIDASANNSGADPTDEAAAVDDPDGVEACIEHCAEDAILIGTLCTNASAETVFTEGAFDPNDEDGTATAGAGYGGDDGEDGVEEGLRKETREKNLDASKSSNDAPQTAPLGAAH